MEQVWLRGTQGIKNDGRFPLDEVRRSGPHATAYAFMDVMDGITHDDVRRMYVGSGIIRE